MDITNILLEMLLISLWCVGWFLLFNKDYKLLFWRIDCWYDCLCENRLQKTTRQEGFKGVSSYKKAVANSRRWDILVNPLWGCISCLASLHTILWKTILNWESITLWWYVDNWAELLITIVGCIALNNVIYKLIKQR